MDQVRVGLIGVGGFARYRVGNLLKVNGVTVTAMADTSADNIAKMKETHPGTAGAKEFADYHDLLKQDDVDAVMIMTPHTQHVTQILDSLAAGKHTCVEKPMVTTVEDAHKVIAARDKAGKVGMVSYQRHFEGIYKKIKSMIDSGEAGEIQFIAGLNCQEWKVAVKGTWRQDPALSGGGQLNDTGSHFVDIILHTSGLKAETVSALAHLTANELFQLFQVLMGPKGPQANQHRLRRTRMPKNPIGGTVKPISFAVGNEAAILSDDTPGFKRSIARSIHSRALR